MSYYEKVYALARRIPPGQAATYGQLALMTGSPRASRVVVGAMAACSSPSGGRTPSPPSLRSP